MRVFARSALLTYRSALFAFRNYFYLESRGNFVAVEKQLFSFTNFIGVL
jgi:hypothetical protein